MIKMICDKCKLEVDKLTRIEYGEDAYGHGVKIGYFPIGAYDLCDKCLEKLQRLEVEIRDFMAMSDEEIELALYTFKVGDRVITSTGEVGTITNICTCNKCKERGFYEPEVKTEIGNYKIYITDNDKRVNFRSFYQIGDHIFGNIDEDYLLHNIESKKGDINNAHKELIELEDQLEVLKKIKKEKDKELGCSF